MAKTIILWLADLHSGSTVSLYPDKTIILTNGPRGPSALQKKIYKQWAEVLERVAVMRQDADRLVVVNMGDAVEGDHHHTLEVVSGYLNDHQKIHLDLMHQCKEITQYDTLYYVNGTEVHAGEDEDDIAEKLKAVLYAPGNATHPILKKTIYKHLIFAAHHGPGAGKGWNRGNALRNKIKALDYDLRINNERVPEIVVYAHRHEHRHEQVDINGRKIK